MERHAVSAATVLLFAAILVCTTTAVKGKGQISTKAQRLKKYYSIAYFWHFYLRYNFIQS